MRVFPDGMFDGGPCRKKLREEQSGEGIRYEETGNVEYGPFKGGSISMEDAA
jgi:hypothetical protein